MRSECSRALFSGRCARCLHGHPRKGPNARPALPHDPSTRDQHGRARQPPFSSGNPGHFRLASQLASNGHLWSVPPPAGRSSAPIAVASNLSVVAQVREDRPNCICGQWYQRPALQAAIGQRRIPSTLSAARLRWARVSSKSASVCITFVAGSAGLPPGFQVFGTPETRHK